VESGIYTTSQLDRRLHWSAVALTTVGCVGVVGAILGRSSSAATGILLTGSIFLVCTGGMVKLYFWINRNEATDLSGPNAIKGFWGAFGLICASLTIAGAVAMIYSTTSWDFLALFCNIFGTLLIVFVMTLGVRRGRLLEK